MKTPGIPYMKTMSECLNDLNAKGYSKAFKIKNEFLQEVGASKLYAASEVYLVKTYRFEGQSDPADNAIIYVVETKDGVHGTLVDAYGVSADPAIGSFFEKVSATGI